MSQNINNISINNFNNLCRTCSQSNDLVSIHENIYLIEMLSTSAQIQIQLNDELPKNICLNCIQNLNQTYSFISKCRTTDATFRQCLTQQKLLNLRKNYEKNRAKTTTTSTIATTTIGTTAIAAEEIFVKTEIFDINDSTISDTDECSKDSIPLVKQPIPSIPEFEESIQPETNHYEDVCANFNESFPTDPELVSNLNDCQFTNLLEPMELNESSDDESHDDPLDVTTNSIPKKSSSRYKREHILFLMHCKQNNLTEFTEDVVLNYFQEKAKTIKPTSLGSLYSMLKRTLSLNDGVDISKYSKLYEFVKRKATGYIPTVSKTFTREQINRFLREAPDETYLMMKVVMIMGIVGGCQRDELMRMTMDDIEDKSSVLIVNVPIPKTKRARTFLITGRESGWIFICRKYYEYRASLNTEHRRLFVNYKNGKYFNVPVGKNTLGRVPRLIAGYLKLPNVAEYSGHCFRRTAAMLYKKH